MTNCPLDLKPNKHVAGLHPQELHAVPSLPERRLGHEDGEALFAAGGVAARNGNDAAGERDREASLGPPRPGDRSREPGRDLLRGEVDGFQLRRLVELRLRF